MSATSMRVFRLIRIACGGAILLFLAGCEDVPPAWQRQLSAVLPIPAPSGWWEDHGAHGTPRIVVSLGEQKAYFYRGKTQVGESTVSTGKRGFGTPVGHYHVVSKDRDHVSSEFGDYVDNDGYVVKSNIDVRKDRRPPGTRFDGARMPYCMHFNGGYAMHEGYVPPFAASHGCIRLPKGMAERFYDAAPVGTAVVVRE